MQLFKFYVIQIILYCIENYVIYEISRSLITIEARSTRLNLKPVSLLRFKFETSESIIKSLLISNNENSDNLPLDYIKIRSLSLFSIVLSLAPSSYLFPWRYFLLILPGNHYKHSKPYITTPYINTRNTIYHTIR